MLQIISKLFSNKKKKSNSKSGNGNRAWAEKQIREMGKLRGKLILM